MSDFSDKKPLQLIYFDENNQMCVNKKTLEQITANNKD